MFYNDGTKKVPQWWYQNSFKKVLNYGTKKVPQWCHQEFEKAAQ